MKQLAALLVLTLPIASCGQLPPGEAAKNAALCLASERNRIDHAKALTEDGGPRSKETGARLLGGFAIVCD